MIGDLDDFNFYLTITKPLLLNLPNARDRTVAASWLQKLREIHAKDQNDKLPTEYLKLLLFAMQTNKLHGIFEKSPPEGTLQPFPDNKTVLDMISLTKSPKSKVLKYPSIFTSVSGDLRELVAVQEIPYFGLHGYYAISSDPISKWIPGNIRNSSEKSQILSHNLGTKSQIENSEKTAGFEDKLVSPICPSSKSDSKVNEMKGDAKKQRTEFTSKPPTIFQAQRREIPGVETRPCWGRNRYIERLIDESPHLVGDLDLSQADAFLHSFKNKKMKKVEEGNIAGSSRLSSRRRAVERMMDLPSCAVDPGEDTVLAKSPNESMRTCKPESKEDLINIDYEEQCLINEDEEDDDDDLYEDESPYISCDDPLYYENQQEANECKYGRTKEHRDWKSTERRPEQQQQQQYVDSRTLEEFDFSFNDQETIDIDESLLEATKAAPIDPETSGNFKWLKYMEAPAYEVLNPGKSRRRHQREQSNKNCYLGPGQNFSRRDATYTLDRVPNNERSYAILRKTTLKSRDASGREPEVKEKTSYWQEIIDQEEEDDDLENPELTRRVPQFYYTKRVEEDEVEEEDDDYLDFSDEEISSADWSEERMNTVDSPVGDSRETITHEMRQLLTDSHRRAPPSRGKVKMPSKNAQGSFRFEGVPWKPTAHSSFYR